MVAQANPSTAPQHEPMEPGQALCPWIKLKPQHAPKPMVEQTAAMGMDHDKNQVLFYKEAFATSMAATEALKALVQSFDKTSAMA